YYYYGRYKAMESKFQAADLQNTVYSSHSNSYLLHLQNRLAISDSVINVLMTPFTKIMGVESEKGTLIFNEEESKYFIKVDSDEEDNQLYRVVFKSTNREDTLEEILPKGVFEEVKYLGKVESVKVLWQ